MINLIDIKQPREQANELRDRSWNKDLSIPTKNVLNIVDIIRAEGDTGIFKCIEKYDHVKLKSFIVTMDEIQEAYEKVSAKQIKIIKHIKSKLEKSEQAVIDNLKNIKIDSDGIKIKKTILPIDRVGCYIPGGKARYPSTIVMCTVPAKVAGVGQIVAITPPMTNGEIDPLTLVAGDICGVDEFYKIGGAYGIAALAYGTQTIRKVDKIVGPGGVYVSVAKSIVSKDVSIDMIAGPTELLVYADEKSNAFYVALDLISQSEHSEDTLCGVVTKSKTVADNISREIDRIIKIKKIPREELVIKSMENNGFIALCQNNEQVVEFINEFAPEHLEIFAKEDKELIKKIHNAGLILIGKYTPSAVSDYCLGSNHVLPTYRFAKSRAALSVLDFIKLVNVIEMNKNALKKIAPIMKEITSTEGLINHYNAVEGRIKE
ncbi:histidinol dehydrogenase [Candidatus Nitrosocosmicus agrestis]|uniref:histidinol dehydrogenase n=1 Tax=Candidatus Nitrosocosmicus agrestis TaxID=2563600 RepID=UPI00122E6D8D|nr:histidinol dehydrogenase [Candidatus Nitrosocosmicus sp. SS]KAA2282455.1 histidinol dehydrogenase [Candidatus Nitrosocosmicus sp. SS]KAF0868721.1 histidinol dehydrogenase [Candidatus Nitrosocosmicus sp. SS]MDR4489696.1 histidinol dehydrogenase [Candidatus Nitrosocosmicus sp.]